MIYKLKAAGINPKGTTTKSADQPLSGLRFVITGRLEKFSRSQIEVRIRELGGTVTSKVSTNTNYLIAGKDAGSKLQDAKYLGTITLTEKQFIYLTAAG